MNGYSFPSRRTFAIAGRCRRSLLQQTVYRSWTEPTHISRDADSNSRSSTIHNSAMAMKSPRVLRGQLASQNAFAMLQLFSCWLLWGGLPLLFLRWLSWTRTLPVITRTDTTLVDTMKNRVVAAADSTFQKSLRHCFLFVNKYVMIVFLFTKASPLIGLIRRPKLSRIAQRIIHIWRTNIPKIRIALHYRALLYCTFRWRILTHNTSFNALGIFVCL